jgi:hypothetical protein
MRTFNWLAALTLCVAAPVSAQTTKTNETAAAVPSTSEAPTIADRLAPSKTAVLLFAPATVEPAHELPVVRRASSKGTALAIVGGALFVGGLVAGGDAGTLMVVSGAAVGAWGLYLMFR